MEDMRMESPKPKTGVIVAAILVSAVIFGGLGFFIGTMYETVPAGTVTYVSPSASAATNKTYSNAEGNYSLQLPSNWTIEENAGDNQEDPTVTFSNPETAEAPYDISVTHFSSIAGAASASSVEATTLKDLVVKDNKNTAIKSTILAGQPAYATTFVELGGSPTYYAIIAEDSGEVYIIRFPQITKESELSSNVKSILDSFKFTK